MLALALLLALAGAVAFLWGFYPAVFHSDSAVHYVLARAMVDETSVLPHDFAYGNQLILWRNNLFIAPLLAVGVQGYRAYAIGSALSIAFWFCIAFAATESLVRDWRKSLFVCGVLFVPLGHSEADFILGEQSHIGAVVLSLVLAVQTYRALQGARGAALLAGIVTFLLTLEAPTRTALLLLPLGAAVFATVRLPKSRHVLAAITLAAVGGYAVNKWLALSHHVHGIPPMPLAAYDHFLSRMSQLGKGVIDYFIGFYQFEGMTSGATNLALYGFKTLVLVALAGIAVWSVGRLWRHLPIVGDGAPKMLPAPPEFFAIAATLGAVLGFWVVCVIEYWLDIRHFLWALVLLKFALILVAVELATTARRRMLALGAVLVFAFASSTAASSLILAKYRERLRSDASWHARDVQLGPIHERMEALGIRRIYGDFWTTLRLEALIPDAQASALEAGGKEVKFAPYLVRPSRRCVEGPVLYLLDKGAEPQVRMIEKLLAQGGKLDRALQVNQGLYVGPPIWDRSGCP